MACLLSWAVGSLHGALSATGLFPVEFSEVQPLAEPSLPQVSSVWHLNLHYAAPDSFC